MVRVYPFAAIRPDRNTASAIAAVPYDVVTVDEARAIISENPKSFLRVSRSDAELVGIPPHDDRVYQRARDNFHKLIENGSMVRDALPAMYLYSVVQNGEIFLGLCCCVDVDDYRTNCIRRHEQTRYDKEEDRTRHIEVTRTHNGPVVLLYRDNGEILPIIESLVPKGAIPDSEVHTPGGAVHRIYRISDVSVLKHIEALFACVPFLYIADGHHRAKSAVNVAERNGEAQKNDEITRFMGVLFPHDRVRIHGYSRLLTDLGAYSKDIFLEHLKKYFNIRRYGNLDSSGFNVTPKIKNPHLYHIVHMYLGGTWYECVRRIDPHAPPLDSLDVATLQKYVLGGMLGITDPRGDSRLRYLGGARPIRDLEQKVDCGEYALAFAMQPVGVDTILAIADANGVMPPKSTWFEPKLLSGLIIHTFE
ncbi:MAG: DUF1015 family protein [Methanoregula sp.]|nr:DUF1015 family protein [Methanoregula sp.]